MTANDNRMGWVRNSELLTRKSTKTHVSEYEIGSDCRIPGVLNYGDEEVLCGLMTVDNPRAGLYSYALKVKLAETKVYNPNANRQGYFLKEGIMGELLGILSLYFRCRFYMMTSLSGDLTSSSIKTKTDHDFLYRQPNHSLHPEIFSTDKKNFALGINDFLDSIKNLDPSYHQKFALACYHYGRALREVGIDTEMVFIRLVSAVEALAPFVTLDPKEDLFQTVDVKELLKCLGVSGKYENELANVFSTRKSRKRFLKFILQYSKRLLAGWLFSCAAYENLQERSSCCAGCHIQRSI